MSGTEDVYAPEEPTVDVPISLLDIQMPETPESTKGQVSDGDTSRLESPKMVKPVLGKVQAKKRLMAFVNKLNVLPKVQSKSNLLRIHSTGSLKHKDKLIDNVKALQRDSSDGKTKIEVDSGQSHGRSSSKLRKKTEEKILAIEEIRREESKSKLLLAEAMAAASMEEESFGSRNGPGIFESNKSSKEKDRHEEPSSSRRGSRKSSTDRKFNERRWQYSKDENGGSTNREHKDQNGSKDRHDRMLAQERDQRRKDRERREDREKREENRMESGRDRREDARNKRDGEREKWEESREKKDGMKEKRETLRERRSGTRERTADARDKRDKEKNKYRDRDKELLKCTSWVELKKSGMTSEEMVHLRRRNNQHRFIKNRTAQDYKRYLDQMLMVTNYRMKRYAFIAEGIEGPKEFPPESIKVTQRGRAPHVFYAENPRMSLLVNRQQLLQTVSFDRREKIREICDVTFARANADESIEVVQSRNWYLKMDAMKLIDTSKWQLPVNVQFPRSKWDSEDEDTLPSSSKEHIENESKLTNADPCMQQPQEEFSSASSDRENIDNNNGVPREDSASSVKEAETGDRPTRSPLIQPTGDEKLASEYEQFMKMVCTDIPISTTAKQDGSPKKILAKSTSPLSYHEFNLEGTLPEDKSFTVLDQTAVPDIPNKVNDELGMEEKSCKDKPHLYAENVANTVEEVQPVSCISSSCDTQKTLSADDVDEKAESEESRSIPSDWENVTIKVERLSDENSESRMLKKKKVQKRVTSSSESSSSSSSSESEVERKRKKRKRKLSNDSSSSDSESSDSSSSSSSDSSSSDDKRKRKRKRKRKVGKRKKKAKRASKAKRKRRRTVSTESSSSDSDDRRKKKRAMMKKKTKDKKLFRLKKVNNGDTVKDMQKASAILDDEKITHSPISSKKIKEEAANVSRKRSVEKRAVWDKDDDGSIRKGISSDDSKSMSQKADSRKSETDERYLEEWEMDTLIVSQKEQELKRRDQSTIGKLDDGIRHLDKRENCEKDEQLREKRSTSRETTTMEGKGKTLEEIESMRKKKRDKEKRSSTEFLAEWERESERMSRHAMQDEFKLAKKSEKQKKEKWGETEFDTLNVLSLTQLEREVGKRQLLADDWEVDSLEAVPDLTIKRKCSRGGKKIEKELRYDKKTDTYISTDKESLRETRKRQDRLSAMRIWEEEQEEGEREELLLLQEKNMRKKNDWDINEEAFLRDSRAMKGNVDICNIANMTGTLATDTENEADAAMKEWTKAHEELTKKQDLEKESRLNEITHLKKAKKSRWDIESQCEEKIEPKTAVMWEEECSEWAKAAGFASSSDTVIPNVPVSVPCKSKVKEIDSSITDQQISPEKTTSKRPEGIDITDLFARKSQDIDLLERSWPTNDIGLPKTFHAKTSDNIAQRDTKLEKTNDQAITNSKSHPAVDHLKDILNLNVRLIAKDMELYSPSSPAPSQKSEDVESSTDSTSTSSSTKEIIPRENAGKDTIKLPDDPISTSNIPLQLVKFRDNDLGITKTESQIPQIESIEPQDERCTTEFGADNAGKPIKDLPSTTSLDPRNASKPLQMDIFAEYELEELQNKMATQKAAASAVSVAEVKEEDMSEAKAAALKLIPKQLLMRRSGEQAKKQGPQETVQQISPTRPLQKKLLLPHIIKVEGKGVTRDESLSLAASEIVKMDTEIPFDIPRGSALTAEDITLPSVTDAKLGNKDSSNVKLSVPVPALTHLKPVQTDSDYNEEYKGEEKRFKDDEGKKARSTSTRSSSNDADPRYKSPTREQRRKSPTLTDSVDKRYDREKDRKDKKLDEKDRSNRRDAKSSSKVEYSESRKKAGSPAGSRGKGKRTGSPSTSWEHERSGSGSHSRSWSRSASKSPRRKDESATVGNSREKEKRFNKGDDDRSFKSRNAEDRRERSMRSPARSSSSSYNKENFKKHGSSVSKGDRDDWSKRKYDSGDKDRDKEPRPYDPMEMLRERNVDSERRRDSRFREEDMGPDNMFWQYEMEPGNESMDSYVNGQEIDFEYDDRYYRDESLERDIMEGPLRPVSRFSKKSRRDRPSTRRERHRDWEKDRESSDVDRSGHIRKNEKPFAKTSRLPSRSKRSPIRQGERFRSRRSRSRSRSWTRSRSRSRTRSRSKTRSRSRSRSTSRSRSRLRSRSASRSRSRSRSRTRSTSRTRMRNLDHGSRTAEKLRSSRSPSPGRGRSKKHPRERKDEEDNRDIDVEGRGRRIETIVQTGSGVARVTAADSTVMDSDMHLDGGIDMVTANFQYSNENESVNEYYYTENNLTYPPCIDESTTSSPKRLSLDDRLELELGIKKQHGQDVSAASSDYPVNFNPNVVAYPSPPQPHQQQMLYRDQPTVLQVGNVLQVVPADFNGTPTVHRDVPSDTSQPIVRGSSQVVRVGNVLQVVPTSLDWTGTGSGPQTTSDHSSGVLYSASVPSPSSVSVSMPVPLPVPVPMPVPAVPSVVTTPTPVSTLSPAALPLSIPVPVPVPVPIPVTTPAFPRAEVSPPKPAAHPVYNYEAILEARRKEREERKRVRELRRKEKERRKIERINRRALRLLEKNTLNARPTENAVPQDKRKIPPNIDRSVIKALREGEEQVDSEDPPAIAEKETTEEETAQPPAAQTEEEEDAVADDDEDEEEEEEAEAEEDEDDEEPEEDEEEEADDEKSRVASRQNDTEENSSVTTDANKDQSETESKEWPSLPPAPLKGILISPGFRLDALSNGTLDDLSDHEDNNDEDSDTEECEAEVVTDGNKEDASENREDKPRTQNRLKSRHMKLRRRRKGKKSVQFADGIKPGEGTSPSGGEGDMPSPPPPTTTVTRDSLRELRKLSSRKSRKQDKRGKPPKAKKKVKVKIIKLKKPRITPLTAMMMDDSDELDDRSPPPPPPGSPPPPHLWPSYLSAYNTTIGTAEPPPTVASTGATVQAPPPPTPLPLLVPPPPLNYTIQPCSKA